jgi:hypothetical protein
VLRFLKVIVKGIVSEDMSLFPNEDILIKEEIESWRSFGDSLCLQKKKIENYLKRC